MTAPRKRKRKEHGAMNTPTLLIQSPSVPFDPLHCLSLWFPLHTVLLFSWRRGTDKNITGFVRKSWSLS